MDPQLSSALLHAFIQYGIPVLFPALMGLVAWALVELTQKLNAQAKESKVAAVGAKVTHFAAITVQDIEATLKPELESAAADGVVTPEELKKLRAAAIARVKALLADKGLKELQAVFGVASAEVDKYLGGVVEKAHADAKVVQVP